MALNSILGKQVPDKKEPEYKGRGAPTSPFKPQSSPDKKEPVKSPPNKKYIEVYHICKWADDGSIKPTSIKFLSDASYYDWIDQGGPDRDFKDSDGEYFVIRKWEPK